MVLPGMLSHEFWAWGCVLSHEWVQGYIQLCNDNVFVHPQPARPVKADSDRNTLLWQLSTSVADWPITGQTQTTAVQQAGGGNGATTSSGQVPTQPQPARGRATFFDNGGGTRVQRTSLGAAQRVLPAAQRGREVPEWCEAPKARAAMGKALTERWEARRLMKADRNPTTWKRLRAACQGVRAAIDNVIYAHLERYVARLEAIYEDRDMRGLYKHLKRSVGLAERSSSGGQQFVLDESGVLLRKKADSLQR